VEAKGTVNWITPVSSVSTAPVLGRFFASDGGGTLNRVPTDATGTRAAARWRRS
jgi:hypothetical protein